MSSAPQLGPTQEQGWFAQVRASTQVHNAIQHSRAARTVAEHAIDAQDCQQLLAMLGLDASAGKRDSLG